MSLRVKQRRFASAPRAPRYRARARLGRLRTKGLRGNIETFLSILEDFWFQKRYGLVTAGAIERKNIQAPGEHASFSEGYGVTRTRHFRKVMRTLPIPLGSVFVDIGCGAGQVLLLASQYPFARVVGIELSPWLGRLAEANLKAMERHYVTVPDVECVIGDVASYEVKPDENVFFMCDPFRGKVMDEFLNNLKVSKQAHPRPIWLLYNHPAEHERVVESGIFSSDEARHYGGTTIRVYYAA